MCDFGDGARVLHVRCVDAGSENAANLHFWVGVRRGDEGSGGVVDQCGDFDFEALRKLVYLVCIRFGDSFIYPFCESILQHGHNILPFHSINIKSFGPSLQDTMIDVILCGRV